MYDSVLVNKIVISSDLFLLPAAKTSCLILVKHK